MFFKGSRYEKVEEHTITDQKGRVLRYKKTRFIPVLKPGTPSATYAIKQGERLDHIAHRAYRDPERFWRICDANKAMWPDDLTATPGKKIEIPLSED
jgi:hypothetical protein